MSDNDAFALDRARNYAGWVSHTARNLISDVGCLEFWALKIETRRDFETEMEAQLDEAEKNLLAALDRVQIARKRYKALPLVKSRRKD